MRVVLTAFLFTVLSSVCFSQSIQFSPANPHPVLQGGLFGSIDLADIDGDDDLDLLISGRIDGWVSSDSTTLYLNDGMGNFTEADGDGIIDVSSSSALIADLDNDGDDDLLIGGVSPSTSYIVKLYRNDGLGGFTEVVDSPFEPNSEGSFSVGDVNSDGLLDIYVMGTDAGGIFFDHLYLNDGDMAFTNPNVTPFLNIGLGAVELIDLNGDDHLDLFMIGEQFMGGPVTMLHLNDGMGGMNAQPSGIDDFEQGDFAFADFDDDGDQDVIISAAKDDGVAYTELYLNDGAANFTLFAENDIFPDLSLGSNLTADLDADGDLDIILTGTADGGLGSEVGIITNIFENQGDLNFVLADSLTGAYVARTVLGDVNGDGKEDLFVTGTTVGSPTFKTWLFLNETMSVGLFEEVVETNIRSWMSGELLVIENEQEGPVNLSIFDGLGRVLQAGIQVQVGRNEVAIPTTSQTIFLQYESQGRAWGVKLLR